MAHRDSDAVHAILSKPPVRETSLTIETWNDQVGAWWEVEEARNDTDATRKIGAFLADDIEQRGTPSRYRVVRTTTEEYAV